MCKVTFLKENNINNVVNQEVFCFGNEELLVVCQPKIAKNSVFYTYTMCKVTFLKENNINNVVNQEVFCFRNEELLVVCQPKIAKNSVFYTCKNIEDEYLYLLELQN
ncbi:hypothetical protein QTP88_000695 [Uroleucon formosanum]